MRVFRISALAHQASALSGVGAAMLGGRWNSRGVRMVYATWSRSLAILEMLVHTGRDSVPSGRVMLEIDLPDAAVGASPELPAGWDRLPYDPRVQATGDRWSKVESALAVWVPSAVVRHERNLLINPSHPDMSRVRVVDAEPLGVDPRLFG